MYVSVEMCSVFALFWFRWLFWGLRLIKIMLAQGFRLENNLVQENSTI